MTVRRRPDLPKVHAYAFALLDGPDQFRKAVLGFTNTDVHGGKIRQMWVSASGLYDGSGSMKGFSEKGHRCQRRSFSNVSDVVIDAMFPAPPPKGRTFTLRRFTAETAKTSSTP
jgi:hypothetical protein